jgi:hypothetical protein
MNVYTCIEKQALRKLVGGKLCSDHTFRKKIMTDDLILSVLGIDRQAYNKIRVFSYEQTNALLTHFKKL